MSIYFSSDLHFGHNKEFVWKARGFSSVEEMNTTIINNWNSVIKDEDEVYLLGDILMGDTSIQIENFKKLKGNIHIIVGNHDTDNKILLLQDCSSVKSIDLALKIKYNKYNFYLSHYPSFSGSGIKDPLHCTCNLYGHTHQTTNFFNDGEYSIRTFRSGENLLKKEIYYMYHVGVDSHNCYPVKIDTIIDDINNKFNELKGDFICI